MDIVIPANDCADTIGATVRAFRGIGAVIVVDGSTGSTGDKALLAGATVVNGKGLGKGECVSLGLRHVRTDRVILCDGDIRGFKLAHALAMAEVSDAMLRGRITGLFRMRSGPLSHRRLAPCLTAVRSLPTWLARGIALTGLAYNEQLNLAATVCNVKTRFVNLDGLSPNVDRAYYDRDMYLSWLGGVMRGDVVIPRARPDIVAAIQRLGWTERRRRVVRHPTKRPPGASVAKSRRLFSATTA